MPIRIILGIGVTLVGFGIAAVRFHWLSRLIRSGKPDPSRTRGSIGPRPRRRSPRSPASASCCSGRCPAWRTSSPCGASRSCSSRSSRPTATSSTSTSTSRLSAPGTGARLHRGLLHRRRPGGASSSSASSASRNAAGALERKSVSTARTRGGLARAAHDRRRHDHTAPLSGGADQHRSPPVPLQLVARSRRRRWRRSSRRWVR